MNIAAIMERFPALSAHGIHGACDDRNWCDPVRLAKYREEMQTDAFAAEVAICREYIARFGIDDGSSSYALKHEVEREHGDRVYVSNGAFIVAAIAEGFEPIISESPNPRFRCSKTPPLDIPDRWRGEVRLWFHFLPKRYHIRLKAGLQSAIAYGREHGEGDDKLFRRMLATLRAIYRDLPKDSDEWCCVRDFLAAGETYCPEHADHAERPLVLPPGFKKWRDFADCLDRIAQPLADRLAAVPDGDEYEEEFSRVAGETQLEFEKAIRAACKGLQRHDIERLLNLTNTPESWLALQKPTKPSPAPEPAAQKAKQGSGQPPQAAPSDVDKTLPAVAKTKPASDKGSPPLVDGADFCAKIPDVDEVVENIIQRGMVYGCTALTGHGKTAVLTRLGVSVAVEQAFGPHQVQPGRVLYLAGENPDDFRARMVATMQEMQIGPEALRGVFHVVPAAFPLVSMLDELRTIAGRIGPLSLIVVDTSAAFFSYADENDNVDARNHAADCRSLTTAMGNPAVIAACHPTKNASKDSLLPRGGGGFLNEVDGNLTVWLDGETVTLHHGKLRGAPFEPLQFKLQKVELAGVKRRNGKPVQSVVARWIDDREAAQLDTSRIQDENRLLWAMLRHPNETLAGWASACGWKSKSAVHRVLKSLAEDKLVKKYRGRYSLTEAGEREARKIN